MKIKNFEATNMKEALEKIKEEMGPEAFILGTKSVTKKGPLGFGERKFLQVTAALDEKERIQVTQEPELPAPTPRPEGKQKNKPETKTQPASTYNQKGSAEFSNGFDTVFSKSRADALKRQSKPKKEDSNSRPLRKEINELKDMVQSMSGGGSKGDLSKELQELKQLLFSVVRNQNQGQFKNQTPTMVQIYNQLMANGIERSLAVKLLQLAEERLPPMQLHNSDAVEKMVHSLIAKAVEVAPSESTGQKVIALVGPTGVGKTTTLAKLAAFHALQKKGSTAFITLDTYRIAAVDQLKTYAHIMDVPLQVALNPTELAQAIQFHQNKGLILIDTAGYSHNDKESMAHLQNFFKTRDDIEIHLVMSATTKPQDLTRIVHNFETLKPKHFIFTKLDETSSYGGLFTQLVRFKKSVSYVTVGQSVPEDIEFPSKSYLADLFLGHPPFGKGAKQA